MSDLDDNQKEKWAEMFEQFMTSQIRIMIQTDMIIEADPNEEATPDIAGDVSLEFDPNQVVEE